MPLAVVLCLVSYLEVAATTSHLQGGKEGPVVASVLGKAYFSMLEQAGAPYFMTKEDLKMVAPMWSTFATKVRNDPKVCLSVDIQPNSGGIRCIAAVVVHLGARRGGI